MLLAVFVSKKFEKVIDRKKKNVTIIVIITEMNDWVTI
jgi:hypothetical protein